jgi:hypothetical protein
VKWTSEKSWKDFPPSESSFLYPKVGFINNPFRGLSYIKNSVTPFLEGGECIIGDEVMFQDHPNFKSLRGSKILIIGAGPSTNEYKWDSSAYDHVISCNHFYKNKSITRTSLSVVFLGDEVKLNDPDLLKFLKKSETLIGFENIGRSGNELLKFKKKYGDRVFWAHTRYHSKIGAIPRIVSFVCSHEPKEVHIVGMDGFMTADMASKGYRHSFQYNKTPTGTLEDHKNEDIVIKKYKKQYLEFWDYILHDIGKNVGFTNLGHQHVCNFTTQVLTEQIGENYTAYLSDPEKRNI